MKLFLSSLAISDVQADELAKLVGKPAPDIKVALIENASDVYESWVNQIRPALQNPGFAVEVVDLRKYRGKRDALEQVLYGQDVIWLGGGNTFYLRWILRETGADEIIKALVAGGVVYGGDSAGAIMAGPTLKHFEIADDPSDAPELILDGLHLTDSVVVPHMDNAKFAAIIHGINDKLKADGYKTVPLTDMPEHW